MLALVVHHDVVGQKGYALYVIEVRVGNEDVAYLPLLLPVQGRPYGPPVKEYLPVDQKTGEIFVLDLGTGTAQDAYLQNGTSPPLTRQEIYWNLLHPERDIQPRPSRS